MHRVKLGVRASIVLSVSVSILIGLILYPISGFLMRMFSRNEAVLASGVSYLHCVLPFYSLLAVGFMFNSVMRGAGEMIVPMISSFIALWLARIPAAYIIADIWGQDWMFFSYAVGWLIGLIISGVYYATGRWKNKSIVQREAD